MVREARLLKEEAAEGESSRRHIERGMTMKKYRWEFDRSNWNNRGYVLIENASGKTCGFIRENNIADFTLFTSAGGEYHFYGAPQDAMIAHLRGRNISPEDVEPYVKS